MTDLPILSSSLREGRRSVEGLSGVQLLRDFQWNPIVQKWILHYSFTPGFESTSYISSTTNWFVLIDSAYPWGSIKLLPDKANGISHTFQHQSFNSVDEDKPWRNGDICLSTPLHILGRPGLDDVEPHDAPHRLRWHIERALAWLISAAKSDLVKSGDPFELPVFPTNLGNNNLLAFNENTVSYEFWQRVVDKTGYVEIVNTPLIPNSSIVQAFFKSNGEELWRLHWGSIIDAKSNKTYSGLWFMINSVPILDPWQIPSNWGELRKILLAQGIDLDNHLKAVVKKIRDGYPHFALLGFPIPDSIGSAPSQIHWQAIRLPTLTTRGIVYPGFRNNELGYWQNDRTNIINNSKVLDWVLSGNWSDDQLVSRGSLDKTLAASSVTVIGAGALGCIVSELLVRTGVRSLKVIDGESLETGNLVRHNLTLSDIQRPKAEALAAKLNLVSPNAVIEAMNEKFPPQDLKSRELIRKSPIVIDCTGNDDVLDSIDRFGWDNEKIFVSLSLGMQAHRLFCFFNRGAKISHELFSGLISPWLEKETFENQGMVLPRAGIGCWHPVFPARLDNVYLFAAVAINLISEYFLNNNKKPELLVYELDFIHNAFNGIKRVQ